MSFQFLPDSVAPLVCFDVLDYGHFVRSCKKKVDEETVKDKGE